MPPPSTSRSGSLDKAGLLKWKSWKLKSLKLKSWKFSVAGIVFGCANDFPFGTHTTLPTKAAFLAAANGVKTGSVTASGLPIPGDRAAGHRQIGSSRAGAVRRG